MCKKVLSLKMRMWKLLYKDMRHSLGATSTTQPLRKWSKDVQGSSLV